jgi:hypothetical protein
MTERIQHPSLAAALAAAQGEFPEVRKTRTATIAPRNDAGRPHTYKYADLADVMAAIRPVLAKHGIAVMQPIVTEPGGETLLRTELRYGEQRETSEMPLPIHNLAPQLIGSLLTYYRRYALTAMLGIAADEDDDAQAANDEARHTPRPQEPRQQPRPGPRRQVRPPPPPSAPAAAAEAAPAIRDERDPLGLAALDLRAAFRLLREALLNTSAIEADHLLVVYHDLVATLPEPGRKALGAIVARKIEQQAAE